MSLSRETLIDFSSDFISPAPKSAGTPSGLALGNLLLEEGRLVEAVAAYLQAIDTAPAHPDIRTNLGVALARLGRHDEAVGSFHAAATLQPFAALAQVNLGQALAEAGHQAKATDSFRRALTLDPARLGTYLSLAQSLRVQDRHEETVESYRNWLALASPGAPERAGVFNNLGNALRRAGHIEEAIASFQRGLLIKPEWADLNTNLGYASLQQRKLDNAEQSFRTAVRLDPDHVDAHVGLAMTLLTQGSLQEGFAEYEWRWRLPQLRPTVRTFEQPQWQGEPAGGQTLLIHAEQGFGDTLQFCRYAPLAAKRGFQVVLEVQAPLVRLLRRLPGLKAVIARGEPIPAFDLHCPMLSLPRIFDTRLETIPSEPYLTVDPTDAAIWKERLAASIGLQQPMRTQPRKKHPRMLNIGLVWAGNSYAAATRQRAVDRRRSMMPELLRPLFDIPNARFVSLQKEADTRPNDPRLIDLMDRVSDFADTAALVANLDIVVTVDTAVAHLAASLGCPVWLLDRFDACWRWPGDRQDSPWYPSIHIYRQRQAGEWTSTLIEVDRDLRALIAQDQSK